MKIGVITKREKATKTGSVMQETIGLLNQRGITVEHLLVHRSGLIADNDIKGTNFNIQVHSGVVYLLGLARTEEELRKAAEHASLVNGVSKVISYVKMREREQPPADISIAAAPPSDQQGQPIAVDTSPGAIKLAPVSGSPAPILQPDAQPTTRAQYTDPYAPGAAPPPGSINSGGLQSSPLPPPKSRN